MLGNFGADITNPNRVKIPPIWWSKKNKRGNHEKRAGQCIIENHEGATPLQREANPFKKYYEELGK